MSSQRLRQFMLVLMTAMLGLGTVAVYSASALASEATYGGGRRLFLHHRQSLFRLQFLYSAFLNLFRYLPFSCTARQNPKP